MDAFKLIWSYERMEKGHIIVYHISTTQNFFQGEMNLMSIEREPLPSYNVCMSPYIILWTNFGLSL